MRNVSHTGSVYVINKIILQFELSDCLCSLGFPMTEQLSQSIFCLSAPVLGFKPLEGKNLFLLIFKFPEQVHRWSSMNLFQVE